MHSLRLVHIFLSDYAGIANRQCQSQHNQICIRTVEAVSVWFQKLAGVGSHELHDLVLTLAWSIRPREYNTQLFPVIILTDFLLYKEVKHIVELFHKLSSWRNGVVFKIFLTICSFSITVELGHKLFVVLCGTVASWSLVIHFTARSHSVQRHQDHLGRLQ